MKREGGGCTQIIIALIGAIGVMGAALLGGPLVEEWLDKNDTNNNNGGGVPGGAIQVIPVPDPPIVNIGQETQIRVQALDSSSSPLSGATVTINAGGGVFLATGSTTVSGITGNDGYFRTTWRCDPCAPMYIMDVHATKPNFTEGVGAVSVIIQ